MPHFQNNDRVRYIGHRSSLFGREGIINRIYRGYDIAFIIFDTVALGHSRHQFVPFEDLAPLIIETEDQRQDRLCRETHANKYL